MMKIIPQALLKQFDAHMADRKIPKNLQGFYRRWLKYYLDFCDKYNHIPKNPDSLPGFINKLREKNQPKDFQKQAYHSILMYYDIRTIQELLGHSDIRTTMIYTHTVKSRTLKEAGSPLDL